MPDYSPSHPSLFLIYSFHQRLFLHVLAFTDLLQPLLCDLSVVQSVENLQLFSNSRSRSIPHLSFQSHLRVDERVDKSAGLELLSHDLRHSGKGSDLANADQNSL
jgi:hypothetical protein